MSLQSSPDTHSRTFGFLRAAAPGTGGSIVGTAGSYSAHLAYSQELPSAAAVTAIARTAQLYIDRSSLRVAYALTDANGEPRVSQSGLAITLGITFANGAPLQRYGCGLPDVQSGLGECVQQLPPSMFGSTAQSVQVSVSLLYDGSEVALASAGSVSLMAALMQPVLSSAGMIAMLPQSPRFVDDEFEVVIVAHTGPSAFALKGWSFLLEYDVSVLSLRSSAFSAVYQTPTTAHDSSAGSRVRARRGGAGPWRPTG